MKKILFFLSVVLMISFVNAQNIFQTDTLYMNITVQQADTLIQNHIADTNFIIIDVRTPSEYNGGFIEDAVNINYYAANFGAIIDTLDKNKIYLVYCGSGNRSAKARDTMVVKHFVTVYNMLGGTSAWVSAGYSLNMPTDISDYFSEKSLQVFPNPVSDISTLDFTGISGMKYINIYDAHGEMTKTYDVSDYTRFLIDQKEFEGGIYIIRITNDQKFSVTRKFLVAK